MARYSLQGKVALITGGARGIGLGIAPKPNTARQMDPIEFERVVEVDLLGVYRTVHAALPQVIARRGQAVLVASVYAFLNGMLLSPYAVSKAGVEQLGRALRGSVACGR